MNSVLDFNKLRTQNVARCEKVYHKINKWSPSEWAVAVGGECGELLNVVKKLKRVESPHLQHFNKGLTESDLIQQAKEEMGDIVIYLDLLAERLGINLGDAVINKFNKNSEEAKSDIFL